MFQEESGPAPLMCGGIQREDDMCVPVTRGCGVLDNPGENQAGGMTGVGRQTEKIKECVDSEGKW